MFNTVKQRFMLLVYVFLVLSIPIGSYLVSQQQIFKSRADEAKTSPKIENPLGKKLATSSATTSQQEIQNLLNNIPISSPSTTPTPTPTSAVTFGPTMNFDLILEGRPTNPPKQSSKVFVGISAGIQTGNQSSYLLSFTVDLPDSGKYEGLSLAGLTEGSQYTAYIKPTVQIATSSAFIMSPSITTLNSGTALKLITGDLNQDNVINTADYNIAKSVYGTTPSSANWNEEADFNKDKVINNYDLAYITKNMGQTGTSGPWVSTPTTTSKNTLPSIGGASVSSDSALPSPTTHPDGSTGYWLWVPK